MKYELTTSEARKYAINCLSRRTSKKTTKGVSQCKSTQQLKT